VALTTKIDRLSLHDDYDDDDDEYSEEEEGHPTALMRVLPTKTIRRNVAATETQTFQLSQCAWVLFAVWKKVTGQTLIHM
jgi:hypothetical protein